MTFFAKRRAIRLLLPISVLALVAADRSYWAQVAQWREDQACNIWLGYTQSPFNLPVGLISSVQVPNPNGMALLAVPLSRLPNLCAVSAALGLIQGALVVWICRKIARTRLLFLLAALPVLASTILRATSVEFWNQWLLATVNLWFLGHWISYMRRPSLWMVVPTLLPLLVAPALYLGGAVNAVLFFFFILAAIWMRPPKMNWKRSLGPALVSVTTLVLALIVTWIPYARATAGQSLPGAQLTPPIVRERLLHSLSAGLDFPIWNLTQWFDNADAAFLQSNREIMGPAASGLFDWSRYLLLGQSTLFLGALVTALILWNRKRRPFGDLFERKGRCDRRALLGALVFVILAEMISPVLGGPNWAGGERTDQQIQLLPFLMLIWFMAPFSLNLPRMTGLLLRTLTVLIAAGFTAVSLVNGWQIVHAHLNYKGATLSTADVPIKHQSQAVDFMARDWIARSKNRPIPVSYQHGMSWVTNFGKALERWYPAPMIPGRALDFELLRVYGLRNSQEGVQVRTDSDARYIVTYANSDPPDIADARTEHHVIGRIRVSIVERK